LRSIQFAATVTRVLDATRHDIRQVDWDASVPDLLSDALAHLGERLETERHLVATVRDLIADHDGGPVAVTLLDIIEDCQLRHLDLHALLLRARATFLEEQERQRFTVTDDTRAYDLGELLLAPLLERSADDALGAVGRFVAVVSGPVQPRPLRLLDLTDALLQPRRDDADVVEHEADLVELGDDRRFDASAWAHADAVLARVPATGEIRLSQLLRDARSSAPGSAELVALAALHAFAPEGAPPALRATDDGRVLDDPQFGGRDLLVRREVPA
jgi:hypothetical protein